MRSQDKLLVASALIELGAGLALLVRPTLAFVLLLGVHEPAREALIVGRVCGVALLSLGVACWRARNDRGDRSSHGVVCAMLVYDVGACIVLACAGTISSMAGVALWPAVGLHAVMTLWCALTLRATWAR